MSEILKNGDIVVLKKSKFNPAWTEHHGYELGVKYKVTEIPNRPDASTLESLDESKPVKSSKNVVSNAYLELDPDFLKEKFAKLFG